jgi:hypothetical protein
MPSETSFLSPIFKDPSSPSGETCRDRFNPRAPAMHSRPETPSKANPQTERIRATMTGRDALTAFGSIPENTLGAPKPGGGGGAERRAPPFFLAICFFSSWNHGHGFSQGPAQPRPCETKGRRLLVAPPAMDSSSSSWAPGSRFKRGDDGVRIPLHFVVFGFWFLVLVRSTCQPTPPLRRILLVRILFFLMLMIDPLGQAKGWMDRRRATEAAPVAILLLGL